MTNYNNVLIAFFYTAIVYNVMVFLYTTEEYKINYGGIQNVFAVEFSVILLGLTIAYRFFPKISTIFIVLSVIIYNYPRSKVIADKPHTEETEAHHGLPQSVRVSPLGAR